jgi:hypothetical protein
MTSLGPVGANSALTVIIYTVNSFILQQNLLRTELADDVMDRQARRSLESARGLAGI